MADYRTTLQNLHTNLNTLREREAKYAGNAPLELLNQITGHQKAITLTEQALRGELTETQWREALKPLLVSLEKAQTIIDADNIGIVGDHARVEGGIHFHTAAPTFDQRGQTVGTQYNIVYQSVTPQPIDPETLAAAEKRLATLPLDDIPDPAPLPPGSRMPFSRNPLFVGREDDLRALAGALQTNRTTGSLAATIGQIAPATGQVVAATGLGGIGKTQLASEFVHRYGQYFAGGVFWLSFADPAAIPAEIAACGGAGGLNLRADFGNLPLEDQVWLVASAWQSPLPRLLVFDNCDGSETVDAEALLAQWRPTTGGCRVLVTSRRATWDAALGVQALALGVLSRTESITLLRKFRPDLTEDDAEAIAAIEAIADELGDLPLALHLAGSYLKSYQADPLFGPPANFLAELREPSLLGHPALQGEEVTFSPTDHISHVGRTFALSYARLDAKNETDAVALRLLARAACFAPGEPIPRELLQMTLGLPEDDRAAARRTTRAVNRLVALGLLEQEAGGALLLHRLVAAFVAGTEPALSSSNGPALNSSNGPDQGARQAVEEALLAEANRLNKTGYPAPLLAWQPHLRVVTDVAQKRGDKQGASLCNALGHHLWLAGDYEGAQPYWERALVIREQILGPEHPDTAESLDNLGSLLIDRNDKEGGRPYLERALAIREKMLGPQHPDTLESMNNLGFLRQAMGDYEAARPYYERTLAIREKVLGLQHPDTASSLNNMGGLLDSMGDYEEARLYYERALAIYEQVLRPKHPDTATTLNNLGTLLESMGDYEEARPCLERALAIREQVLGPEHPDTASSLNNLGLLLQKMGDYQGARSYYVRALDILEARLGSNHPNAQKTRQKLAALDEAAVE
jgi:tetratricopeptide (TPR) repeat protein